MSLPRPPAALEGGSTLRSRSREGCVFTGLCPDWLIWHKLRCESGRRRVRSDLPCPPERARLGEGAPPTCMHLNLGRCLSRLPRTLSVPLYSTRTMSSDLIARLEALKIDVSAASVVQHGPVVGAAAWKEALQGKDGVPTECECCRCAARSPGPAADPVLARPGQTSSRRRSSSSPR